MGSENKVLVVLATQDFQDTEYNETVEALKAAGVDIAIGAVEGEECKGGDGTEVAVEVLVRDADATQFQGVVLIGGSGVEDYLHDADIHAFANSMNKLGKIVAAICWAPAILANAGILNGKKATAWSGAAKVLAENGADYVEESVVVDGNIITANGPDASTGFGQAIAKAIVG